MFLLNYPAPVIQVDLPNGTASVGTDVGPLYAVPSQFKMTLSTGEAITAKTMSGVEITGLDARRTLGCK
ncbi:hypothetical protein TSA66_00630 [Noviherbaspirillum autotrophicum]|uniref:Uncharacterized protein n=1 Tax=Noviherbaspirillum autotrophicum TaxID=709839 RepID=A0A0C1YTU0_9BURK|nr:hypothetical protein TSA66_14065 [Noviherbaspirillum autotrophicum]KIF82022.1 hypothetical protein TSA66_16400 [Noviherbaspirillum autotrophicum]KIF84092.1 hypothetical protein TSA66_00630 [Noviherbaspirillum autotrophicum]